MKTIIVALVAGFILFELMEHVVLPLIWSIKNRKKGSVCGVTGMLGKMAEVKQWDKREGQVFVNGELWQAVSDDDLFAGDKTVVQDVKGLTLKVKSLKHSGPGLYL